LPDFIAEASSDADYRAFADLVREYWQWLVGRYEQNPGFIDKVGDHQGLEDELNAVPRIYGPPEGKTLLVVEDGRVCAGGAYRDLHDGSCEMKRLFVSPSCQGRGIGRRLCGAIISAATGDGFRLMRLDTGYLNTEATRMYQSLGFRPCPPFHDYPPELLPYLRFMEKLLA
jgi:ribosomal protein S18 acetylase RimI-like enzyme